MQSMCNKVVVFDLDDTLYKEMDFLKSGYRKVAEMVEKRYGLEFLGVYDQLLTWYYRGENAFACLNDKYGLNNPIEDYLNIYRYHHPSLELAPDVIKTLTALKDYGVLMGVISDGREETQNNKIEALGLSDWINSELVFINEEKKYFKPSRWSFDRMMLKCFEKYVDTDTIFYYVGDNPEKDFLAPNEMGWETICLKDDGKNIHKQRFEKPKEYLSKYAIEKMEELLSIING